MVVNLHAKLEVSSSYSSRDMDGVPKLKKVRHVTPFRPSFTEFFIFLSSVPLVVKLCAKFEVSSWNRYQDMEGVPKFKKVGYVTPFRPSKSYFLIFYH